MRPDNQWLERFADTTRQHILRHFRRDSCIASTRIGLAVLRHFGVLCRPQAVTLTAMTAAAFETFSAGRDLSGIDYSVGIAGTGGIITQPDGRQGWDGHLVIVLTQPPILVDLSLDQLDRPARGLRLPQPGVFPLPRTAAFRTDQRAVFTLLDGTVLTYETLANDTWKQALNWTGTSGHFQHVTAEVINQLERGEDAARLAETGELHIPASVLLHNPSLHEELLASVAGADTGPAPTIVIDQNR